MYFFIILIFIIILAKFFIYKFYNKKKNIYFENNEYDNSIIREPAYIYLFYARWCPHSKETIIKMKDIKKRYKNNKKYNLVFEDIDVDKRSDMANLYNIESYPTIILKYKNIKYIYDTNLEDTTFDMFIETTVV